MTQESIISNHVDDVSPSGSAYSSGEIYRMTLEENGDLFMENNGDLRGIANGDVLDRVDSGSLIINSPGTHLGTKVMIKVDGPTTFVTGGNKCLENGEFANAPPITGSDPPKAGIFKRNFKVIIIVVTITTLVCAIALITMTFVNMNRSSITTTTEEPTTRTTRSTIYPTIHYIFNRTSWSAKNPVKNLTKIISPVSLVVIKHTGTGTCTDVSSCLTAMKNLQNTDVGVIGLNDIRYNLVIGGDGNIYEGRGWYYQNEQFSNSIDIAYMGNFSEIVPSAWMVSAGTWIVVKGMLNGFLEPNTRVVCHNQTAFTDSPGSNLYSEVVKWKFYSNKTI